MTDLVRDVAYAFDIPMHAKIGFAFRYGIALEGDSVDAYFKGYIENLEGGERIKAKLNLHGATVEVVLLGTTIITALPKKSVFKTKEASLINNSFDITTAIDPSIFPLIDIVVWRKKWMEAIENTNHDDLRREISKRVRTLRKETVGVDTIHSGLEAPGKQPPVENDWTVKPEDAIGVLKLEGKDSLDRAIVSAERATLLADKAVSVLEAAHARIQVLTRQIDRLRSNSSSSHSEITISPQNVPIPYDSLELGVPPNVASTQHQTAKGKLIFKHEGCIVRKINMPEDLDEGFKDDWFELIVQFEEKFYVVPTRFRHYARSYREGDQAIYTVKYGDKYFLTDNQE